MRVIGVEQYKQKYTTNTFLEAGSRLLFTVFKLPVFLTCLFYFFDCECPLVDDFILELTFHSRLDNRK
jgi:hypothetical protein